MGKRQDAEAIILEYIDKIAPGGQNKQLYVDLFKSMNNNAFDKFMNDLRTKKISLSVIAPNGGDVKLTVKNNMKVAKELGYDFFQHIDIGGEVPYRTPNKYMVYRLPIRRAAQLLTKKISIPTDSKSIDLTTGQVTGKSKSAKITMPEIQILAGLGLNDSIKELMTTRGGNLTRMNASNKLLLNQGSVSAKVLDSYGGKVVSTETLKSYFIASHIDNNL